MTTGHSVETRLRGASYERSAAHPKTCSAKGIRRQGIVLKHRNSLQKSPCPVVICPSLSALREHILYYDIMLYIHNMYIYIYIYIYIHSMYSTITYYTIMLCIYIYIYTHTYIYIYIYICAQLRPRSVAPIERPLYYYQY